MRRELRLPEITAEACVHHRFEGAACRACVDACPRGAWLLDDERLGLDVEACDGCGLCVPACPPGALGLRFPWVVRTLVRMSHRNPDVSPGDLHAVRPNRRKSMPFTNPPSMRASRRERARERPGKISGDKEHPKKNSCTPFSTNDESQNRERPGELSGPGASLVALFACERSALPATRASLPCIHGLGLRQLLLLYNSGVRYLVAACGSCERCPRNRGEHLQQRLARLQRLLKERQAPAMKLLQASEKAWLTLYRGRQAAPRGANIRRREFLRGAGGRLREQLVALDPLNRPECRRFPPGELLPAPREETAGLHWPFVPEIEADYCSGCDLCSRLCPNGAIRLEEREGAPGYTISPQRCDGCGLCVSACTAEAVAVRPWAAAAVTRVELEERRCSACGNRFHEPRLGGEHLCRICRTRNHAAQLFQVID